MTDLYRRAFLVGDKGALHAALSDFDQSAQQHKFPIKGDPFNSAGDSSHSGQRGRRQPNTLHTGAIST
jgi:hypothetical protein